MEFPHLAELSEKISDADFALLAVNTRESQKNLVREMVSEHGADWPVLTDVDGSVSRLFGIRAVPTTLFIDRDGRIIFKVIGFREGQEEDFELMINALLERGGA